jgi:RNA polymerase sigma factor (TIGR02999 family)
MENEHGEQFAASEQVTRLLKCWSAGDRRALEELVPLIYDELRVLARRHLQRERPGHTLQTTALVHEAYLRLADQRKEDFSGRAHFFAVAAQVMRRVLVDHARRRRATKRGGELAKLSIQDVAENTQPRAVDFIALDEALQTLERLDPRQSRVVELRYFGGLSVPEVAEVLGASPATIKRDWVTARAWLRREIRRQSNHDA